MFGFKFGNKKILGVDVGTSTLKIIELEIKDERPFLSNYAWMRLPNISQNGEQETAFYEKTVPQFLKNMVKKADIEQGDAYIAIPAFGGLITLIDFPAMPAEDMEQAIKFEAHKYIPTSLDEVTISWEIVDEARNSGGGSADGQIQVLLVAASKAQIMTYEKLSRNANISLKGVEIESISMTESLVGNDKGNFIIVDIGCRTCNIVYLEKGVIKANRNIDAGGEDITRAISTGLGITAERAEEMKKSGKNFFSAESSIHFSVLDTIIDEISRILETISGNSGLSRIDAVIISGGTANLNGLREVFQEKLSMKTIIGDPFCRLDYDKWLAPKLELMRGPFAVCVGLALKGVREHLIQKNK